MNVINPITKRPIRVGGPTYTRLVMEGVLVPQQPPKHHTPPSEPPTSAVYQYQVLPRLNIVTIRRITSLTSYLRSLNTSELFWRNHVSTLPLRHDDTVVAQLVISRPWRGYALIYSPRMAARIYELRELGGEVSEVRETRFKRAQIVAPGGSVPRGIIDYQRDNKDSILHYDNYELVHSQWTTNEYIPTNQRYHGVIQAVLLPYNNIALLTIDGVVNIERTLVRAPTGNRIINIVALRWYLLLLLADGSAVLHYLPSGVFMNQPPIVSFTIKGQVLPEANHRVVVPAPIVSIAMNHHHEHDTDIVLQLADGTITTHVLDRATSLMKDTVTTVKLARPIVGFAIPSGYVASSSMLMITDYNQCYGLGTNAYNVLGTREATLPTKTPLLSNLTDIVAVSLGSSNSQHIHSTYAVFVNDFGQAYVAGVLPSQWGSRPAPPINIVFRDEDFDVLWARSISSDRIVFFVTYNPF